MITDISVRMSDDFFLVIRAAIRYSLGRRTYMPSAVTHWIMGNLENYIPVNDLNGILKDIDDTIDLGDKVDQDTWKEFRTWVQKERDKHTEINKVNLMKALEICSQKGIHNLPNCNDCPYFTDKHCLTDILRHSLAVIKDESNER